MPYLETSLLDILVPPGNPWLRGLIPGKTVLPKGVRVVRHNVADEESLNGDACLDHARARLHECAETC